MTPKQFLQIGGAVLVLVAILGFVKVIGPTPQDSLFGQPWFFTTPENWAHLVLGVAGLAASFVLPPVGQKWLVLLLGVLGVVFGIISIFLPGYPPLNFGSADLENPADTLLHLVVGAWALWAALNKKAMV